MSYSWITKQKKGSGRSALEAPSEESCYLRLMRSKEDAETQSCSLFIFNADQMGVDVDSDEFQGFHLMLGSDYAEGMVAIKVRDDLEFEINEPEQAKDKEGNLLWEDEAGIIPKMTQERVVYRGPSVYNARVITNSNYLNVSSGGKQIAQTFDLPHGQEVWLPLEYNDEAEVWEGNLREAVERID